MTDERPAIDIEIAEALDAYRQGHWTRFDGVLNELKALAAPHLLSIIGDGPKDSRDAIIRERVRALTLPPDNFDDLPTQPSTTPPAPAFVPTGATASCLRGVHDWLPPAPITGWRVCAACGYTNVAPPEDNGPVDVGRNR
jgi:hypothetical protein